MTEAELWNQIFMTREVYQQLDCEEQIMDFLRLLHKYQIKRIVEMGCGCGRNLLPMAAQGFEVIGVDHSSVALEAAKNNLQEKQLAHQVQFIHQDWTLFQQPSPAVVAWHVLGHGDLAQVEGNLRQMIRLVEEGGLCLFNIPSIKTVLAWDRQCDSVQAYSFIYEEGDEAGIRHSFFSYDKIVSILQDEGVTILAISEVENHGRYYIEATIQCERR